MYQNKISSCVYIYLKQLDKSEHISTTDYTASCKKRDKSFY